MFSKMKKALSQKTGLFLSLLIIVEKEMRLAIDKKLNNHSIRQNTRISICEIEEFIIQLYVHCFYLVKRRFRGRGLTMCSSVYYIGFLAVL